MTNEEKIKSAFLKSRKLKGKDPSARQIKNVVMRLAQIFTPEELDKMDEKVFVRQVERVWPVAQYVDRD